MAIANICKVTARNRGATGVDAPDSLATTTETKTLSASSQATTMTASPGEIWSVTANGDCLVLSGTAPTALAAGGSTHQFVPSGQTRFFNATVASEKLAVISPT